MRLLRLVRLLACLRRPACTAAALVLLLLTQLVAPHGVAAGAGDAEGEICTSGGHNRVATDEHPGDPKGAHHDCCCTAQLAVPPAAREPDLPVAGHLTFIPIAADRLAAEWLAPLSRGPPALS